MQLSDYIDCLKRRVEEYREKYSNAKKNDIDRYAAYCVVLDTIIEDLELLDRETYWDIDGVNIVNVEIKQK